MMDFTRILVTLVCNLIVFSTGFAAGDAAKGQEISGACAACHGATGLSVSDDYPNLAGQKQAYLLKALQQYQSGQRSNATMQAQVGPLDAKDIENLAAYYAAVSIMPSYSSETGMLHIPVVNVATDRYQVDMGIMADSTFKINSLQQLK